MNLRCFWLTLATMEPSTLKYFEMQTDSGILDIDSSNASSVVKWLSASVLIIFVIQFVVKTY
jgi:hypothetical protein